jgi:predicted nucleotidyltransferase
VALVDESARAVIQQVVVLTCPDKVFLFGSRVRGDAAPDSDLDLLVVVPDPVGDRRQRQSELQHALVGSHPIVEPWIMGRIEFEETKDVVGGLAYPATHEGVLVYEKTRLADLRSAD